MQLLLLLCRCCVGIGDSGYVLSKICCCCSNLSCLSLAFKISQKSIVVACVNFAALTLHKILTHTHTNTLTKRQTNFICRVAQLSLYQLREMNSKLVNIFFLNFSNSFEVFYFMKFSFLYILF